MRNDDVSHRSTRFAIVGIRARVTDAVHRSLFGLMSPRVRLPLVELGAQAKAEIADVLVRLCDEHSESMIGKIGGSVRVRRAMAG